MSLTGSNLFNILASNFAAVGCGFICGYFVKSLLARKKFPKTQLENQSNSMDSQVFSDFIQGEYKLVLVVQNGLKMGKGKIAAQCSHASVMAYQSAPSKVLKNWMSSGQRKVVVKVDDEETMMNIAKESRKAGLLVSIVCDAGRTQVAPGSKTVLAVGPGPLELIDSVTGHLKLL